ncbi:MAG TPA: hypothetical protein VD968_15515, partial [Pyrinomonadaceae bacterium]|nr:hypothetical protein [Pyrinomonadaceae bacterium]
PPAAEDDDFILDLGFDDEPKPSAAPWGISQPHTVAAATAADAPSAFAEAARGERQPSFAGTASSSPSFAQAERASSAAAEGDDTPWRDVVMQDGPGGFVFEAESEKEAPLGPVEPEVVPVEEPVPATVEGEFTDGSVEGDLPKPPAAGFVASSGSAPAAPAEPSTEGFAVGEARVGIDERPAAAAAGRLSPEEVDAIARRVVELMSDRVVREIAWEVVPELAERLTRRKLEEERGRD